MSQLLICPCGGRFAVPPQPQPTAWRCPHCGGVCLAPVVEAPPVVAPPPMIAIPRPSLPVETLKPDKSPLSPEQLPRTILLVGGGLIAALVLINVVKNALTSDPIPRKETTVAAKRTAPAAVPIAQPEAERPPPLEGDAFDGPSAEIPEPKPPR